MNNTSCIRGDLGSWAPESEEAYLLREFLIAQDSGLLDFSLTGLKSRLSGPSPQALNSIATWVECLVTAQIDGTAIANTGVATSLIPPAARYTLPSNYFGFVGKSMYVKAFGRCSTQFGGAGVANFNINLGTIASPITVWTSGTFGMSGSATNVTWMLDVMLTCRTIGSGVGGTLMGVGMFQSPALAATSQQTLLPFASPVVGTGFDTTITNVWDLQWDWGTANPSNSIQLHEYMLVSKN